MLKAFNEKDYFKKNYKKKLMHKKHYFDVDKNNILMQMKK